MSSVLSSANASNPAVKRIMREYAEFAASYSAARHSNSPIDVVAGPLDDNLFEWHFTVRGPPGSSYAGGLYHGRVLLPSNYPFRPPDIVMLTPSGRFETGKKICLSISSYHPNNWQPSWSIRTALTALSAFFTTPAAGAIGSLDYPDREKQQLAAKSPAFHCPHCKLCNAAIIARHSSAQPAALPTDADSQQPAALATTGSHLAASHAAASLAAAGSDDTSPPASNSSGAVVDQHAPPSEAAAIAAQPRAESLLSAATQRPPHVADETRQPTAPTARSHTEGAGSGTGTAHPLPLSRSSLSQPAPPAPAPRPAPASASAVPPTAEARAAAVPQSSPALLSASSSPSLASSSSPSAVRPSRSTRLSALTVSLAALVAALLFRKLVAHLMSAHPSHASILLNSM